MYGVMITRSKGDDVVKVSSTLDKAKKIVSEEVDSWIINNQVAIKKSSKIAKDLNLVKEAIQVDDYESAMDLFALITEKCKNCTIMTIASVEIIADS